MFARIRAWFTERSVTERVAIIAFSGLMIWGLWIIPLHSEPLIVLIFAAGVVAAIGTVLLLLLGLLGRFFLLLPLIGSAFLQIPLHILTLHRAARALGWEVPRWWRWPRGVHGSVASVQVYISRPHLGLLEAPLQVSVSGLPSRLTIEAEGLSKRLSKAFGEREIVTGDKSFDERFFVRGEARVALSALDATTREGLLRLGERWGIRVEGCSLELRTRRPRLGVGGFVATVREAAALVSRSVWRRSPRGGLAENARHDPVPEVRLKNLSVLASEAHWRLALSDPSELVRARAALALGGEGLPTLVELVARPTLDAAVVVEIVEALGSHLTEPLAIEVLETAVRLDRRSVARAVIEALGRCGSTAAVSPVRAAIDAFPLDMGLRRAAHTAITRIQSGVEGAEAGQLSMADALGDAGQLSMAEGLGAAGQLSLGNQTSGKLDLEDRLAEENAEVEAPRGRRREAGSN